jgi:hypothetical protein
MVQGALAGLGKPRQLQYAGQNVAIAASRQAFMGRFEAGKSLTRSGRNVEQPKGPAMTSAGIFLISFVSIASGFGLGMALPGGLLNPENREVVRLGTGLLVTLAAVLISLMIASTKNSYDTQDVHFRQLSAHLVLADQLLSRYGPETVEIRKVMRQAVPAAIDRIWKEKATSSPQSDTFSANSLAERFNAAIDRLTPATDEQRAIKARLQQASADIANTRLLMFADGDNPILTPFLLILIVWLTVIFISFGLFVEPGPVAVTVLLVFALSVSSALFLIADLSQPYAGLMQISREPLRTLLSPLD